jgi:hypothetical protein
VTNDYDKAWSTESLSKNKAKQDYMAEVISLFSVIISLVGLLYGKKKSADQATKNAIDKFEAELKEFLNNVFGWYNKIFLFTNHLVHDAKAGKLTPKKLNQYQKLLDDIRGSDQYYSNCKHFIHYAVESYLETKPFSEVDFKSRLQKLQHSYNRFESIVIFHKDSMGQLLHRWGNLTPKDKDEIVDKIKMEMQQIQSFKDAVRDALI